MQSNASPKDAMAGIAKHKENARRNLAKQSLPFSTVNLHQPTPIGNIQASCAECRELVFFAIIKITTYLEYDLKVR